jgi:hypothetical protein
LGQGKPLYNFKEISKDIFTWHGRSLRKKPYCNNKHMFSSVFQEKFRQPAKVISGQRNVNSRNKKSFSLIHGTHFNTGHSHHKSNFITSY